MLDDDDYEFAGKLDRDMKHRLGSNLAFVSGLQSNTFKNGKTRSAVGKNIIKNKR